MADARGSSIRGRAELPSHEARILLLLRAISETPERSGKLDGLTLLAKLDFLVRYPELAVRVLPEIEPEDPEFHLADGTKQDVSFGASPMIRYKFGPWDDRYFPIIGSLVGRGLVDFRASRRGNVALALSAAGTRIAELLIEDPDWNAVFERALVIAASTSRLNGNELKELIYGRLSDVLDRPHRTEIR